MLRHMSTSRLSDCENSVLGFFCLTLSWVLFVQALDKFNIEKDIAAYIKKEFDKKYNPTWHCIVGRNFGQLLVLFSAIQSSLLVLISCPNLEPWFWQVLTWRMRQSTLYISTLARYAIAKAWKRGREKEWKSKRCPVTSHVALFCFVNRLRFFFLNLGNW